MFCGLIFMVVLEYSQIFWVAIVVILIYFRVRNYAWQRTVITAEYLRHLVAKAMNS